MLAAMRRASSRVSKLAAVRRPGSFSLVDVSEQRIRDTGTRSLGQTGACAARRLHRDRGLTLMAAASGRGRTAENKKVYREMSKLIAIFAILIAVNTASAGNTIPDGSGLDTSESGATLLDQLNTYKKSCPSEIPPAILEGFIAVTADWRAFKAIAVEADKERKCFIGDRKVCQAWCRDVEPRVSQLLRTANPDSDADVLRYPAPELHSQTKGCVTVQGKSTISEWPYVSRICVGDTAVALDIACHSVADLYHTDKDWEDTLEDVKSRERKFGCKDIDGVKLRIVEVYQESDADGHACGLDYNRNKWCLRVEAFEGTTTVTMPNGQTFKK
jgi:hypothetical protein